MPKNTAKFDPIILLMLQRRKASETENDDCKAQYCKVRRGKMKLPDTLRWIECEKCQDWYHVVCTTMKKGITQQELAAIEWACIRCNKVQRYVNINHS
jgi:RNase P subunit RPR2